MVAGGIAAVHCRHRPLADINLHCGDRAILAGVCVAAHGGAVPE